MSVGRVLLLSYVDGRVLVRERFARRPRFPVGTPLPTGPGRGNSTLPRARWRESRTLDLPRAAVTRLQWRISRPAGRIQGRTATKSRREGSCRWLIWTVRPSPSRTHVSHGQARGPLSLLPRDTSRQRSAWPCWASRSARNTPAPSPSRSFRPERSSQIVVTRAEPDQTYALYLPSSYDARRRWPVIYAFDPAARGQLPLECFKESAEKYGYIVVGSNISRNGPVPPSLRAGLAMMRDMLDRFSVDERRLYATGFSGGARVASTMAQVQKGRIAGVIGCAAGFPEEENPSAQTPFAFCGTIGNEDYNWVEMNRLDRTLASLDKPHRLLRFSGGHTWPPKDVAMAAVEWLELQAMKAGTRPKDSALIEGWLQRDLSRAKDEESRGALYEAWLSYSDVATAFPGSDRRAAVRSPSVGSAESGSRQKADQTRAGSRRSGDRAADRDRSIHRPDVGHRATSQCRP